MYLTGKLDASKGIASYEVYDAGVYVQNGSLYATGLYEGGKSIHESFDSDWGYIGNN